MFVDSHIFSLTGISKDSDPYARVLWVWVASCFYYLSSPVISLVWLWVGLCTTNSTCGITTAFPILPGALHCLPCPSYFYWVSWSYHGTPILLPGGVLLYYKHVISCYYLLYSSSALLKKVRKRWLRGLRKMRIHKRKSYDSFQGSANIYFVIYSFHEACFLVIVQSHFCYQLLPWLSVSDTSMS